MIEFQIEHSPLLLKIIDNVEGGLRLPLKWNKQTKTIQTHKQKVKKASKQASKQTNLQTKKT